MSLLSRAYYFVMNPHKLPEEYLAVLDKEGLNRAVCDYLSGMSDRYAISLFETLFIPKSWSI